MQSHAPGQIFCRGSVDIGDDPDDQIVAQPDEQGVIAGAHPDIAAWRCGKLAMFAIAYPPVIGGLAPVKPLALGKFMPGAARLLRCRRLGAAGLAGAARLAGAAGLVAAVGFRAGLLGRGFLVLLRALAVRVFLVIIPVIMILRKGSGGDQKGEGA